MKLTTSICYFMMLLFPQGIQAGQSFRDAIISYIRNYPPRNVVPVSTTTIQTSTTTKFASLSLTRSTQILNSQISLVSSVVSVRLLTSITYMVPTTSRISVVSTSSILPVSSSKPLTTSTQFLKVSQSSVTPSLISSTVRSISSSLKLISSTAISTVAQSSSRLYTPTQVVSSPTTTRSNAATTSSTRVTSISSIPTTTQTMLPYSATTSSRIRTTEPTTSIMPSNTLVSSTLMTNVPTIIMTTISMSSSTIPKTSLSTSIQRTTSIMSSNTLASSSLSSRVPTTVVSSFATSTFFVMKSSSLSSSVQTLSSSRSITTQSQMSGTPTSTTLVPLPTNSNSSRVGGQKPAFLYPSGYRSMIYHTNWAMYGRAFNVVNLQIDYISDINYAFFNLIQDANGFYVPDSSDTWADFQKRFTTSDIGVQPLDNYQTENLVYGNFGQFIKLRNLGKNFNFGISIGGWTQSVHFSTAMRTSATRAAFVNKIMYWTNLYPMLIDRWDFDWEYISAPGQSYGDAGNVIDPNDAANFGLFLASMRSTLDAAGYTNVELSACTTANPSYVTALPIQAMVQYLDTFNIMTYDFSSSSWGPTSAGHNSNLLTANYTKFSVVLAVDAYISMGVPKSKIVIGVPFYSRGFANTDGVGLPSSGVVSSYSWESGVSDYKVLPLAGAVEMFDSAASASYSYDAAKRELLSYETVLSLKAKLRYMWDMGLKGTITWESSADFPASNPRCLTKALYDGMQQRPSA